MVKKKKPVTSHARTEIRTNVMRAHAMSRALTTVLALTAEQLQCEHMPDLLEAIKALRAIASVNDNSAEPGTMWMRGLARRALKNMKVTLGELSEIPKAL